MKECMKRVLLNFDINPHFITYQDKINVREPNYRKKIYFDQDGHDLISASIARNLPIMVSRLGRVELSCVRFYLQNRLNKKKPYPKRIIKAMSINAGFFPECDELLDKFAENLLEHIKNIDIMGVWFNYYEDVICNNYCKDAALVEIGCLESFRFKSPWSGRLKGKKVLVVHPFVESIKKQYSEKRRFLFDDPDVLPDFALKTVKAIQSIAGSSVDYASWFGAYEHMCDEITKVDFDTAIIGAGAYGLPLASFVKRLGKQAIHLGGVTQILFGVKGKRWEIEYADTTAKLFNEHWIRPLASEIPEGHNKVENGCYW
jgi:hypothetical protein